MRLALAAVLACGSADNATTPRPNATALLEAATKLRAEAAALEKQAQAEAAAPAPTPAPTTPAPTPWSARPFRTRREDNRSTCSTTVEQCRKAYPGLLRRIDWDLAPWRTKGITPNMTDKRYEEAVGNAERAGRPRARPAVGAGLQIQECHRPKYDHAVPGAGLRRAGRIKLCGTQISGAPRHRRDVGPVTASARWRGRPRRSTQYFHTGIKIRLHDERPRAAP